LGWLNLTKQLVSVSGCADLWLFSFPQHAIKLLLLEVENGTRNVANLDRLAKVLASCENASVTEKDFKSCAMRTVLMRDENIRREFYVSDQWSK